MSHSARPTKGQTFYAFSDHILTVPGAVAFTNLILTVPDALSFTVVAFYPFSDHVLTVSGAVS